jgi:hypothetical protein
MGQEQGDKGDEEPDDDIAQRWRRAAHHVIAGDEPLDKPGYVHDRPSVTRLLIDIHNLHPLRTKFQHDERSGIVELYSSHNMVEQAHLRSVFPLW